MLLFKELKAHVVDIIMYFLYFIFFLFCYLPVFSYLDVILLA